MCNLINVHTYKYTCIHHTYIMHSGLVPRYLLPPSSRYVDMWGRWLRRACPHQGELAIRRVQHRSETYSNESQHLAEGTEVARLRRRFSFVLQQALPFRTRHHLCRQGVALASTRQPPSQGPASVQAHGTGGVTGSENRKERTGSGAGLESGVGTETVTRT